MLFIATGGGVQGPRGTPPTAVGRGRGQGPPRWDTPGPGSGGPRPSRRGGPRRPRVLGPPLRRSPGSLRETRRDGEDLGDGGGGGGSRSPRGVIVVPVGRSRREKRSDETPSNTLWDPKLPAGPPPQGAGVGAALFPRDRATGTGTGTLTVTCRCWPRGAAPTPRPRDWRVCRTCGTQSAWVPVQRGTRGCANRTARAQACTSVQTGPVGCTQQSSHGGWRVGWASTSVQTGTCLRVHKCHRARTRVFTLTSAASPG